MKYVIDRNSLINLNRYYLFDKKASTTEYKKFKTFFENKFKNKEIIIIDKVDKEGIDWIKKEFNINDKVIVNTEDNFNKLNEIANNSQNLNENCIYEESEKELRKKKELEKADLSLIAYCKKLKENHKEVMLVTEETTTETYNKKLYKKIPNICENYGIEFCNLPSLIFNQFKNKIKFKITI